MLYLFTDGEDYRNRRLTVTFNPGDDRVCESIPILDDDREEPNEEFSVTLESTDSRVDTAFPNEATVTIQDDDGNLCNVYAVMTEQLGMLYQLYNTFECASGKTA